MQGYIKLSRNILDSEDYLTGKFDNFRRWLDLLLLARWTDGFYDYHGMRIPVKRGQLAVTCSFLGSRWGVSRTSVVRTLERYKNEAKIVTSVCGKTTNAITLISIVNYDKWQIDDTSSVTSSVQSAIQTAFEERSKNDTQYEEERIKNKEQHISIYYSSPDFSEDPSPAPTLPANVSTSDPAQQKGNLGDLRNDHKDENTITPYEEIRLYYNNAVVRANSRMPKANPFQQPTKNKVRKIFQLYGLDAIKEAIDKAVKNPWYNGIGQPGPRVWIANFPWLMQPNKFEQTLNFTDIQQNGNSNQNTKLSETERRTAQMRDEFAKNLQSQFGIDIYGNPTDPDPKGSPDAL